MSHDDARMTQDDGSSKTVESTSYLPVCVASRSLLLVYLININVFFPFGPDRMNRTTGVQNIPTLPLKNQFRRKAFFSSQIL